mgnify:CR=1 FL=1
MVSAISGSSQAISQTQQSTNTSATSATQATQAKTSPTENSGTKTTRSTDAERYTAVQQNLANSKTAIGAASTANKENGYLFHFDSNLLDTLVSLAGQLMTSHFSFAVSECRIFDFHFDHSTNSLIVSAKCELTIWVKPCS